VRAFSHLLGECGVTICGTRDLAAAHRRGFPRSLASAPMLLPTDGSSLRRAMDLYLDRNELRPRVAGEFEDSALLASFGRDGLGLFPVPSAVERDVTSRHGVEIVGRLPEVRERFYALSIQRRLVHPAVVAIREVARTRVFRELTR
jgi:LysR family transcriptional activator of nhaA